MLEKSFAFAVRVVGAYQYLVNEKKEVVLSKQFLRSGTAIGANCEEAVGGQSKADFISKLSIAYKEARETNIGSDSLQRPIISMQIKPKAS